MLLSADTGPDLAFTERISAADFSAETAEMLPAEEGSVEIFSAERFEFSASISIPEDPK